MQIPDELMIGGNGRTKPNLDDSKPDASTAGSRIHLPELVEEFSTLVTEELSLFEGHVAKMRDWLQLYEAQPRVRNKTFPWPGASNIVVGIVPIQVDQVAARIMQALFANQPHWTAQQLNKKFSPAAKPLEKFLDWHRQHTWNQYSVVKQAVLEMLKVGTGIILNDWRDIPVYVFSRELGQPVESGRLRGPYPQWIPREDFLIPSGYFDHQLAPWLAIRYWMSPEHYQQLVKSGLFEMFEELMDHGDTDTRIRQQKQPTVGPATNTSLLEFWRVFFNRDLDEDGYPEPYELWLHRDKHLGLLFEPNVMLHGSRPVTKLTYIEREGEFDGMGIPEMVMQYQEEASTIHNQNRDNTTVGIIKCVAARIGSGITTNQKLRPGAILPVQDPATDLKPFSLGGVPHTIGNDEQSVFALANQRVGLNDVNMGNITPPVGRATASTVLSQLQEGTRRFDLNTSEIRRQLSHQGLQIIELYQTHGIPEPNDPGSPEMILDPEDAAVVRALLISQDRVEGSIAVQLNVSTAAVNREIEKQSTIQLFGTVTGYFGQLLQILPILFQPNVPDELRQMILHMLQGTDRLLDNVFQSHQRFDLSDILLSTLMRPDDEQLTEGAPGVAGEPALGSGDQGAVLSGNPYGTPGI